MNENRISVKQFVEEYKKITSETQKKQYIKNHITKTYCPIFEKMTLLKTMNEKSVVDDNSGKYIDMTVSKLNTVMSILFLYTDFYVEKDDNGIPKSWECYDLLQSTKILGKILEAIGDDIDELMTVQAEVMNTWHEKNVSTRAFITELINKGIDRLIAATEVSAKELYALFDNEEKMKIVNSTIKKLINKTK